MDVSKQHLHTLQDKARAVLGESLQDSCLYVDSTTQQLEFWENGIRVSVYPVSTAKNGLGCEENSYCTPTGLHRISEKIGDEAVSGSIFVGREETGQIADIEAGDTDTGLDQITSRIMWLEGMETGINHGGAVDSHSRYIYIHGTNEEGRLGQPVSHGCVRMANADIIELYDRVDVGTLVLIA